MRHGKEAVEEFQELYEKEFGERLSFEEAEARANEIVELYVLLAQELPEEKEASQPDPPAEE